MAQALKPVCCRGSDSPTLHMLQFTIDSFFCTVLANAVMMDATKVCHIM